MSWPLVKIGDILVKSEEWVTLNPSETYREVTVRLWGKGVVLRREALGTEIASARRKRIRAGQLILSRIDARSGALGIVPDFLNGAVVSNDFPVFTINADRAIIPFVGWFIKTEGFADLCRRASEGSTNRVRLQDDRFQSFELRLPPIPEQEKLVARVDSLMAKIGEAKHLKDSIEHEALALIGSALQGILKDAPKVILRTAAPIVRRPTEIDPAADYPELGIRSFGRGTFHKPSLKGLAVGSKRLFHIEPGDLVFSNVFAWEGAVAVAKREDSGRFGSHRFITCVPKMGIAKAEFLRAYFRTREGLDALGAASPGGAGRNRTLGVEALQEIQVPLPKIGRQEWFVGVQEIVEELLGTQRNTREELESLVASILNKAFKEVL